MKPTLSISFSFVTAICVTMTLPSAALAVPTVYNYVGNSFTEIGSPTLGYHVTASVTFKSDFAALGEVKGSTDILSWAIATETLSFGSATGAVLDTGSVFNFQNGIGMREWFMSAKSNGTFLTTGRASTSSNDWALSPLFINRNQYVYGTWTFGGVATPVPEPTSIALMSAGVAALLLHRRRRVKHAE